MIRFLIVLVAMVSFSQSAKAANVVSCDSFVRAPDSNNPVAGYGVVLLELTPRGRRVLSLELKPAKDSSPQESLHMNCSDVQFHPTRGALVITKCASTNSTIRVLKYDGLKLELGDDLVGRPWASYYCEDESSAP